MIDWLNDNSGAVQAASAVVLALTLIAVVCYAYQTRKQANATERMAEEMLDIRHGDVLPVLDFFTQEGKSGYEPLAALLQVQEGVLPETFGGRLKNIGYGPALDVKFQTKLDDMEPGWQHVYRVERDEYAQAEFVPSPDWQIYLEPVNDFVKRLRVEYHNVYGRAYHCWREVTFDRKTGNMKVGHLHTEPTQSS